MGQDLGAVQHPADKQVRRNSARAARSELADVLDRKAYMNSLLRSALGLIVAWALLLLAITAPVVAQESIRVSYATLSPAYMDHIVAMDKGYLKEEGLSVEVIRAPGGVAPRWSPEPDLQVQEFIRNKYRVLLTRARVGVVFFVPRGSASDPTNLPSMFNHTVDYLESCGATIC